MSFFAFISYSRKDKEIANWLHAKLEKYPYPVELVAECNRPEDKERIRPVFIDTKDLKVDTHPFSEEIKVALEQSRYLILLCSRNSVASQYVDREVSYFLKVHDGDYSRIVPLFVDEVEGNIPDSILNSSVMERHFPIYNSGLNKKSEANVYCFYQIAAYMLGLDFTVVYNRYEKYAARKQKQRYWQLGSVIAALIVIIFMLFLFLRKQNELTNFEKNVFPLAVVYGYEENFLRPVILHLKEKNEDFSIYVLMPEKQEDLRHQSRITDVAYWLKKDVGVDSIWFERLKTHTKRGSQIARLCKGQKVVDGIYLDFASTTTSFLKIAEYKKGNHFYKDISLDEIIHEYASTFIVQTKELLGGDSVYVRFFTDKRELINAVKKDVAD